MKGEKLKHLAKLLGRLVFSLGVVLAAKIEAKGTRFQFRGPLALEPAEKVLWADTINLTPPAQKNFYNEFVSPSDSRIQQIYQARWETQLSVQGTLQSQSHYDQYSRQSIFSASYWQGEEEAVRHQTAVQSFRIRIDSGLQTIFTDPERCPELNRVKRAFESIKETSVSLSRDPNLKTEIQMGYDIASDQAKAEVSINSISAGFYHPQALSDGGNSSRFENAYSTVSMKFDRDTKAASLRYPLRGNSVITSYGQPLSRSLFGSVSVTQSLQGNPFPEHLNFSLSIPL